MMETIVTIAGAVYLAQLLYKLVEIIEGGSHAGTYDDDAGRG